MKVSCIVLNFNDAGTTKELVSTICGYEAVDSVVIVDNCSTDDSGQQLKSLVNDKVHLVISDRNGGYGYGNNKGIRYAVSKLCATHVLIANPDVQVTENCIIAMKQAFSRFEKLAVAAAVTTNQAGEVQLSSWRLNGLLEELLDTGLVARRLFKGFLNPRPERFAGRKDHAFVDAVLGSFFLADARALMDCGLYDEEVFLYYEEKILGHKLKQKGYRTVLLLNQSYVHNHSVSIDKNVKSILKKQGLRFRSQLCYYKKYLKINKLEEGLIRAFFQLVMAEIWVLTKIFKLSW